jgi:hypothetical protein
MVEVVTNPMHFLAVHRLPGGKENARIIIVRFYSLVYRDDILAESHEATTRFKFQCRAGRTCSKRSPLG